MNRSRWILLVSSACVLGAACSDTARPPARQGPIASTKPAQSAPSAHSLPDNPGEGYGCEPIGPERVLRGVIHVEPFGKGVDGARLDDGAKRWVVSYRADATLIALDGKSVEALGRPCAQRDESVAGPHFDVQTLTPLD